jgi:hypothetical protein
MENGEVVDASEGGEDLGAVLLTIHRAGGTFQRADAGVAIHRDEERIAERARLLQVADVADMEEIEAAIREHELAAFRAHAFADGGEFFR